MNYTREQALALTTDRFVSVTANAGSGKTKVLVDRYFNILFNGENEESIDCRRVVAITFTRKAASEMLAKVVKRIEQEIKDAEDPKALRKLKKIRENLIYARISTIHSFASSLLRDYPIEAGVLPTFTELGKADEMILFNDAITEVFEKRLEDQLQKEELFYLFENISRNQVDEIIRSGIQQAENLDDISKFYSKSDDEIVEFYISKLFNLNKKIAIEAYNTTQTVAQDYSSDSLTDKQNQKFNDIYNEFMNIDRNFETIDDLAYFIEEYNRITKLKIKKNFYNSIFDELHDREKKEVDSQLKKLNAFLKLTDYEFELKESVKCGRIIFGLIKEIYESVSEAKKEAGYLDFNDMILKVDYLLSNNDALEQIKASIDYILVDEFQDTNPLQYRLLTKLCPQLIDPSIPDNINLFIVGDSKQSIYAFRSADVRVFKEATKNICSRNQFLIDNNNLNNNIFSNSNLIETTPQEAVGDITLKASFRLNPIVAAFVNKVCGDIMEYYDDGNFDELTQFEVKYSQLIFAKDTSRFIQLYEEMKDKIAGVEFGSISFLLNIIKYKERNAQGNAENSEENELEVDAESAEIEEDDYDEAIMISRFILDAISGNPDYLIFADGEYRKPNFGDIAILSRSKSGFKSITNEFLRNKIPFKLHSGSGFYSRQEIIDILNYLKFIQNNNDDLAFVSLLKSPFFGFNDTDLLQISLRKGSNYWEKFGEFIKSIPQTNEFDYRINAYSILTEILEIALRVPLVNLLYKIINKSQLYGVYQKSNSAEQIVANINKLIAIARAYQEKGFKNLYDFITDMEILADDSSEAEAAFITGDNVVNIMTIHAAKGLEFPIVIISHTNTKKAKSPSFYIDTNYGISTKFPVVDKDGKAADINLHNFELAKQYQELSDIAEEKRILYVAMTRAKEHLLFSASIKKKKDGEISALQKQLKMIQDSLGAIHIVPDDEFKKQVAIRAELEFLIDSKEKAFPFFYNINYLNYKNYNENLSNIVTEKPEIPKVVTQQVKPGVFENNISATKLLYYLHNKEQYIERYVLGLPDDEFFEYKPSLDDQFEENEMGKNDEINNEKDEDAKGFSAGTLIHKIMEKIPVFCKLNAKDLKVALEEEIKHIEKNNRKFSSTLKQRMLNEPLNIYQTEIIKRYNKYLPDSKPEILYSLPFDYDIITATFDLYVKNENSEWEIWDWKSNRVDTIDDLEAYKNHYEIQMKLYSFFNYLINPNQNGYKARLLFTSQAKVNAKDAEWTVEYNWDRKDMIEFNKYLSYLLTELKMLG